MSEQSTITAAGPELDARMTEIMGWEEGKDFSYMVDLDSNVLGIQRKEQDIYWSPSKDWTAAKEVQAKLEADGWLVEIKTDGLGYTASFRRPDSIAADCFAIRAETEQLALCLAALQTIPE